MEPSPNLLSAADFRYCSPVKEQKRLQSNPDSVLICSSQPVASIFQPKLVDELGNENQQMDSKNRDQRRDVCTVTHALKGDSPFSVIKFQRLH